MKKFYYGQSNEAYFEVTEDTYKILENCICIINLAAEDWDHLPEDVAIETAIENNAMAKAAEEIIKIILTPTQYEMYKEAPIY